MKVSVIFDIGKTNKKCILLDEHFNVVRQTQRRFKELRDEDGFPCDDLQGIVHWIYSTLKKIKANPNFKIKAINFSTYGASFVHLDKKGHPLTPLYNYLKPYPQKILNRFYKKYGKVKKITLATASPPSGMLNAGMQLYWLKKTKPKVFNQIRWSLHFPQYLSYLFSHQALSEITSIGCHTSLWDFQKHDYHQWVYQEAIDKKLAPIKEAKTKQEVILKIGKRKRKVYIGTGIHDSSAALLPYLQACKKPFILLSTGTWTVALNPFSKDQLSKKDLKNDGLNYLRIDGKAVRAARVFLGHEHQLQVKKIARHFNEKPDFHQALKFDPKQYQKLSKDHHAKYRFESIPASRVPKQTTLKPFASSSEAYHQLLIDLTRIQIRYIERVIGHSKIKTIYIDGGFANNDIFVQLLALHFKNMKIRTSQSAIGSALGAAILVADKKFSKAIFKKKYNPKKV